MIKKLFCLLLAFVMLSGCGRKTSDYMEPENRLYISALGFDRSGKRVTVCAEAISIADNTTGDEYSIKHYEGEGDSIESAMHEITKNLANTVNLSHCAVLAVGDNLVGESLDELISYAFENKEITGSIKLISAENAKKLLQYDKDATKPLGFQISNLLAEDIDGIDAAGISTLIKVMNSREKADDYFLLPHLEVKDKNFLFEGTRLYKGSLPICSLSRTETQLLKIAANKFRGGEVELSTDSGEILLKTESARTDIVCVGSKLKLAVKIKLQENSTHSEDIKDTFAKELKRLIISLRDDHSADLLGVGELMRKRDKNLTATEAFNRFLDSEIQVECNFSGGGTQ